MMMIVMMIVMVMTIDDDDRDDDDDKARIIPHFLTASIPSRYLYERVNVCEFHYGFMAVESDVLSLELDDGMSAYCRHACCYNDYDSDNDGDGDDDDDGHDDGDDDSDNDGDDDGDDDDDHNDDDHNDDDDDFYDSASHLTSIQRVQCGWHLQLPQFHRYGSAEGMRCSLYFLL